MRGPTEAHRRYAAALYARMQDEAALRAAADVLLNSPPLLEALGSPCVSQAEKSAVLGRILPPDTHPALAEWLRLLCRNGRLPLLPGILDAYHALDLTAHRAAEAVMVCATPPGAAQRAALERTLAARYGLDRVALLVREDPALLGGFVLTIGTDTYDRSVLGSLRGLKRELSGSDMR